MPKPNPLHNSSALVGRKVSFYISRLSRSHLNRGCSKRLITPAEQLTQGEIWALPIISVRAKPRFQSSMLPGIGVREGIFLGGRNKIALKITIFPKNKQFALKLTF